MAPTSRIEVDLTAISANVRTLRQALSLRPHAHLTNPASPAAPAPETAVKICAVLKADAYSLGAPRIAKRLGIAGVDMIAVYTPEQARALVESAITTPILLLMPMHEFERSDALYRAATRGQLHLTIHDRDTLAAAISISDALGMTLTVHLEIDTGMSRGGSAPRDALDLAARISEHPRLALGGVFNHFACADSDPDFTRRQSDLFSRWLADARRFLPRHCLIHEANSCAALRSSAYHRSMVRVGLALFGYAASDFADPENFDFRDEAARLTPAVRWISHVVQIKRIDSGTTVGYASTWRSQRPTRLALVPVGYADGYPIALSNRAKVGLDTSAGARAYPPVVGRVSMDQLMIDITDIPERDVRIGTTIEVIGADPDAPNHLPTLAAQAAMISHELLLRLSPRLPRQYIAIESPARSAITTGAIAV